MANGTYKPRGPKGKPGKKGAKYANGNYKEQQKAYNRTAAGVRLRVRANRLNRKLGTYGNKDGKDSVHTDGKTAKQLPAINAPGKTGSAHHNRGKGKPSLKGRSAAKKRKSLKINK